MLNGAFMHTFADLAETLTRSTVYLCGLQSRFELSTFDEAGYSNLISRFSRRPPHPTYFLSLHLTGVQKRNFRTNPKLQIFASAAQNCAMQMMSNAAYIQTELPSLTLPEGMSEQITVLCDSLIATKHDVISELFELSEVVESS